VIVALGYSLLLSLLLGLLGPAWDAGGSEMIHRLHHLGAATYIVLILVGLLTPLLAPERHLAAFQQVALALIALVMTSLVVGDPDNHGGNVGIIDPAMLIFVAPLIILGGLHPARRELLRLKIHRRPVSIAIALAGAVPFVTYGVTQALLQRHSWPPAADPHHNGHWMAMAMLAFAIPLVALLAALTWEGWRIPTWSAGAAAIAFGLGSILMPELASSVGRGWGAASVVGGVAFIAVVRWETRHAPTRAQATRTVDLPGD
jgi:hypothetical protein